MLNLARNPVIRISFSILLLLSSSATIFSNECECKLADLPDKDKQFITKLAKEAGYYKYFQTLAKGNHNIREVGIEIESKEVIEGNKFIQTKFVYRVNFDIHVDDVIFPGFIRIPITTKVKASPIPLMEKLKWLGSGAGVGVLITGCVILIILL